METRRPPTLTRFGDVALFVLGALMVAAGIFFTADGTAQIALFVVGAALSILGVFLPRISGTIKITPGSLELTVVQALEATRVEAEREAPEQVEQAVGRAFQRLVESGALTPAVASGSPSPARAARLGRLAIVTAVLLVLVAVPVSLTLWRPPTVSEEPRDRPTAEPTTRPVDTGTTARLAIVAVAVVSGVGVVLVQRLRADQRAAAASLPLAETPETFARRIVDEVTGNRN